MQMEHLLSLIKLVRIDIMLQPDTHFLQIFEWICVFLFCAVVARGSPPPLALEEAGERGLKHGVLAMRHVLKFKTIYSLTYMCNIWSIMVRYNRREKSCDPRLLSFWAPLMKHYYKNRKKITQIQISHMYSSFNFVFCGLSWRLCLLYRW